ncbi:MAG TPA: periplasmic heavy metal sensor [Candidatus Binatia bacterium]|jgi:uncharacterized membrane protein|nr:periplasmic heavy metal sensor [Candidatus Binatia bacterium]
MTQKLKWIILVSFLLNVLLVGILFGQLPRRVDRDVYRQQIMEQAIKKLPESAREPFRQKLEHMRASAEPIRRQIREARDESIQIVIAETFDEAAFDRQVKKINDLRVQMADILKEAAKNLPPDQRRALGEAMKRPSGTASR